MKQHYTHGRRYGRPGGWQQAQQPDTTGAAEWFAGRLPEDWFDGDPTVIVDREEITVIGKLAEPESAGKDESEARAEGRVSRFREETRSERMRIADEAQDRYGRKVSWGVEVSSKTGTERILFTHIAVPVMTRLKQPERQVLDTRGDLGYAIYDINQDCGTDLIAELTKIPHTIRVRATRPVEAAANGQDS